MRENRVERIRLDQTNGKPRGLSKNQSSRIRKEKQNKEKEISDEKAVREGQSKREGCSAENLGKPLESKSCRLKTKRMEGSI